ncbi:DUF3923 family protein [Streptococcus equinus]|uniref:DUF3923 family protein n=1 Tax=Streptococcus equinus TaxID=1335 RepID=UPI003BF829FD
MTNWQKRLIIGLNLAVLFIFLDVSLLIFVRSVNSHGVYQTVEMKWLTFSVWVLCYFLFWVIQGMLYLVVKQMLFARRHQKS